VIKTTLYLPDDLKRAIEAEAARREVSEAEVIRAAIRANVPAQRPRPRGGIISLDLQMAEHVDEYLVGFGEL
jgi:hypothetical protein